MIATESLCYDDEMRQVAVIVWVVLGVACGNGAGVGTGSGSAGSNTVAPSTVPAGSAVPTNPWKVGDIVQVKRDDGLWYEAEVVTAGASYKVLYTYADTTEDEVAPNRLRKSHWVKPDKIEVRVDGVWSPGTVAARHEDGSYDIQIASGETKTVAADDVRGARKPRSHASASSSGQSACTGPAYVMRCGGSCIDTHTDDNNCGQCGTRCNPGKHCDGHGFCRDAQGNP